jgi:restriction system protein
MFGAPIGRAFAPMFGTLAWLSLLGFGAIAAAAYFRSRRSGTDAIAKRAEPRPFVESSSSTALDEAWDSELRASRNREPTSQAQRPSEWSLEVLQRMDWKRLEYLAAAYCECIGFRTEPIRWGADDGIDVKLYRGELPDPVSVVQCKAWNGKQVGVSEIRELLGVMTDARVKAGVFLTTSTFTDAAVKFAEGNCIALVDGNEFLNRLRVLSPELRQRLLDVACVGDWTTPSCPSCGVKLVEREGRRGPFWGCRSFPRCRYTRPMTATN